VPVPITLFLFTRKQQQHVHRHSFPVISDNLGEETERQKNETTAISFYFVILDSRQIGSNVMDVCSL